MPKVFTRNYSTFHDPITGADFKAALDVNARCYVGVADVDDETAARYEGRPGFEVLTDESHAALTALQPAPEPTEPASGDPLTDQKGDKGDKADATGKDEAKVEKQPDAAAAPPPPPPSK